MRADLPALKDTFVCIKVAKGLPCSPFKSGYFHDDVATNTLRAASAARRC